MKQRLTSLLVILFTLSLDLSFAQSSWTSQNSGTLFGLQAVYFIDEVNGSAVGDGFTILHTNDGGSTWTTQLNSTAPYSFQGVYFSNSLKGVVIGSLGSIKITTDVVEIGSIRAQI